MTYYNVLDLFNVNSIKYVLSVIIFTFCIFLIVIIIIIIIVKTTKQNTAQIKNITFNKKKYYD